MTVSDVYLVRIGTIDVSIAVSAIQIKRIIRERPAATLTLDVTLIPSSAVDLGSRISIEHRDSREPVFAGEAVHASVVGGKLQLVASTGMMLSDTSVSRMATVGLSTPESVRSLLRQAGLQEHEFRIEGFEEPDDEFFEVTFPVRGFTTPHRIYMSGCAFVSREVVASVPWLRRPGIEADLVDDFLQADCFITAGIVAKWATDAELNAYRLATEAVAKVVLDARCTIMLDPAGKPRRYRRSDALVVPDLVPFAFVRGTVTGRGWLREMDAPSRLEPIDLATVPHFETLFDRPMPDDLRFATLSLYRAATSDLPLSQNLAIWEAIEFYSSSVETEMIFSKADHRRLIRQVIKTGGWSEVQRGRLVQVKQWLNQAPLLVRLRARLCTDRVPFEEAEFDALARLREARNDSVHGRMFDDAIEDDLKTGIQLVARALVYSMDRSGVSVGRETGPPA